MAVGAGFGWLPSFVLKFPLKGHLVSLIDGDTELAKPMLDKRVAQLSRHDVLDLCLERGLGHPEWPRAKLQKSLLDYTKNLDAFTKSLEASQTNPGCLSLALLLSVCMCICIYGCVYICRLRLPSCSMPRTRILLASLPLSCWHIYMYWYK